MTLSARVALPFGLVAQIVTSDEDRPPPPTKTYRNSHHESCPCEACRVAKQTAAHQS